MHHAVNESVLYHQLLVLFPHVHIQRNVKKDLKVLNPDTGKYLEFDIWIPHFNLCFEFQDPYHYVPTWFSNTTQEVVNEKDYVKRIQALRHGLHLVHVPCWWDGEAPSLEAAISFCRPDIFPTNPKVISLNPPVDFFSGLDSVIPGVGELMLASFPYNKTGSMRTIAANQWWIGEKYDGVRCCWNPSQSMVYNRHGTELPIPSIFKKSLPLHLTDNELWFGRGQYFSVYGLVNYVGDCYWPSLRLVTFDDPSWERRSSTYEKRYEGILQTLSPHHPFNHVAPRVLKGNKKNQIEEMVNSVLEYGGEGLILQMRSSHYSAGRSNDVLKLKVFQTENEGIVARVDKKTILINVPQGEPLQIPIHNVKISSIPQVGDIVTYSFENNSRLNMPSFALITRIRRDLTWDDVVHAYRSNRSLGDSSRIEGVRTRKKVQWTPSLLKEYVVKFAKSNSIDALKPDTWYKTFTKYCRSKNSVAIVGEAKSYLRKLKLTLPELISKVLTRKKQYFKIENRRKFFENYARRNNFDPLVADNWYLQPRNKILESGGISVLYYHGHSIGTALMELFPNIGINRAKFHFLNHYWEKPEYRRKFFIDFAKANNFDPLVAANWYTVPRRTLEDIKGSHSVIKYHDWKFSKALTDLFPNIGLDGVKLQNFFRKNVLEYQKDEARIAFFIRYAVENGFDPLNPENWYKQSPRKILSKRGGKKLVLFHNNSITQALYDLFPDIGIEKSKFVEVRSRKDRVVII